MSGASQIRVAIVDDDPSYRRAVARFLHLSGLAVSAFDSAEAYLEGGGKAPDCLLLDVQLGGMSGFDLQRRLATVPDRPGVVFISGHVEEAITAQAAETGCAFVQKSDPGTVLLEAIRQAAGRASSAPSGSSGRHVPDAL